MVTLVLNLDERLKLRLDALAARNRKPLPIWAAEELGRLAADADEAAADTYPSEWMATFGSIGDTTFQAPSRPFPVPVPPSTRHPE
jgi:hypothetical protein